MQHIGNISHGSTITQKIISLHLEHVRFFFFSRNDENYDSRIFNRTPTLLKFVKVCVSTTLESLKTSASKRDLSARETKDSRVDYSVEQNTSDEESRF